MLEGPVFSRRIARYRACRYEVRRWRDGVIPDIAEAVASPQRLTDDGERARRVLELVDSVPALVWGRDELGTGDCGTRLGSRGSSLGAIGRAITDSRTAPGWRAGWSWLDEA